MTLLALIYLVLLARRSGGSVEMLVAKIFAVTFILDVASRFNILPGQTDFRDFDPILFVIEFVLLVALTGTCVRANRIWPISAAALQLIIVIGHLAKLATVQGLPQVYWGMTTIPTYCEYGVLLYGIIAHSRRKDRVGSYSEWRLNQI